jgi:hypothetical protein
MAPTGDEREGKAARAGKPRERERAPERFRDKLALPSGVLGPRDLAPLLRLASARPPILNFVQTQASPPRHASDP